jgi:YhcH/YjgK/YiaL family protein
MIYDTLKNSRKYFREEDLFYRAIKYAMEFDLTKPDGNYKVDGENIIAKVQGYFTSPAEQRNFENHKLYADIQIMRQGSERQDVVIDEELEPLGPYQEQKDVTKYKGNDTFSSVVLKPGQFVVYYPDDIHRPNCMIGDDSKKVRKICMKVKI